MQLYVQKREWINMRNYNPNHEHLKDVEAFLRSNLDIVIVPAMIEAENFSN